MDYGRISNKSERKLFSIIPEQQLYMAQRKGTPQQRGNQNFIMTDRCLALAPYTEAGTLKRSMKCQLREWRGVECSGDIGDMGAMKENL